MLDLEAWREILDTIQRNKLRTALTGFSVAWGVFILVVLLGSGQGLSNGMEYQFRDDATNSLWISPGQTSLPYEGQRPGRDVQFTNEDHEELKRLGGVDEITSRFFIKGAVNVSYGKESGAFNVRSVHPAHQTLERTIVTEGRFLDDLDLVEFRKTAVIGQAVKKALFKDQDALGNYIQVNGIAFRVVGVFDDKGNENELEVVYLPITTAQRTFNGQNRVNRIMFTTPLTDIDQAVKLGDAARALLAHRHHFAPDDRRALFIANAVESFGRILAMMQGIRAFVWVIGIGTVLAGVVGVSNIMLLVVRDRTREFGIRKAVGATPLSIVALVLQESVLITSIAGILGLGLGVATLDLAARNLPESSFFREPAVDLGVALQAAALIVVAGALAGLVPARRAASIRPIEALRDE